MSSIYSRVPNTMGLEYKSEIIFLIYLGNICFDSSLEPSLRDGSKDGPQLMF